MSADTLRGPDALGPVPSGREVRRLTAGIAGARQGRGTAAVLADLWYALTVAALLAAFAAGIAAAVQDTVDPSTARTALGGTVPTLLVLLAGAGGLLGLVARVGPASVGSGGGAWWLPLPVDRRGLVRPAVLGWPAAATVAGALVAPLVALGFGAPGTAADLLGWAAAGGGAAACLAATAAVAQTRPRVHRALATAGEAVLLGAAVVLGVLALIGTTGSDVVVPSGGLLAVGAALLAAAAALTALAERRAEALDGALLRTVGSLGDRARIAVLSLDLRELGRSLGTAPRTRRRTRSLRLTPRSPFQALVAADAVLVGRTPRAQVQVAVAVLLAVAAPGVAVLADGVPLALAWVALGVAAATSAAAGARQADLVPALDRMMPLAARRVRLARMVVPGAAAALWGVVVLGVHAARSGDLLWLALVPSWAVVLGASAVRAAYRPSFRAPRAIAMSPMGPPPQTGGALRGLDSALIGTVPTSVALWLGGVGEVVVLIQLALAGLVLLVVALEDPTRR